MAHVIVHGALNFGFWAKMLCLLGMVQLTIFSVTLYLHRSQAHRAVGFHWILNHIFRFWLWLTTSQRTDQWVAIHRAHHAFVETPKDPHSPRYHGPWKMAFALKGLFLYTDATTNLPLIEKYAHGTPSDWLEKNLYQPHQYKGLFLLLAFDLFCFGLWGLLMWGVQMLWIPFHAAGVINGLAHHIGYRNHSTKDNSTNLWPFALWIGGEELHNNHHAFPDSAKFNHRWFEIDIGYIIIQVLSFFKLATIKRLPPIFSESALSGAKNNIDRWKIMLSNKLKLLERFNSEVLQPVLTEKIDMIKEHKRIGSHKLIRLMKRSRSLLSQKDHENLLSQISPSRELTKIRLFYEKLEDIFHSSKKGQLKMYEDLASWCIEAKNSGISCLQDYAAWLETSFHITLQA